MATEGDEELEAILAILREESQGKIDDSSLDYMAGMLQDEGLGVLTLETACNLLADFLIDAAVASDEEEVEAFCKKVLEKLTIYRKATNAGDESEAEDSTTVEGDVGGGGKRMDPRHWGLPRARDFANPVRLGDIAGEACEDSSFADPFLGLNSASLARGGNYNLNNSTRVLGTGAGGKKGANSLSPVDAAAEQLQKQQQQRERQLRALRDWEKNRPPLPKPKKRHGDRQLKRLGEGIVVDSFSLAVAGRELLKDAQLKLMKGRRYGLVGRNGIGKSTLLSALVRQEIHGVDPDLTMAMVEQEHQWGNETALDAVLAVDDDRVKLLDEEKHLLSQDEQSEKLGKRLATVYARLQEIDASSAEATAATILSGLGFTETMQHQRVKTFSGGWRMRVLLARCLFSDPDVLLLDEPTNHLDLEAVQWLTDYLSVNSGGGGDTHMRCGRDKIVIVVSHAREFLNDVCTDMIHFSNQTLTYYKGDFDSFETARANMLLQQQRQAEAQQAKAKHIQSFIDRFRYNAKRASLVQSRLKQLSKLPLLAVAAADPSLCFTFPIPEALTPPLLSAQNLTFYFDWKLRQEEEAKRRSAMWQQLPNKAEAAKLLLQPSSSFLGGVGGDFVPEHDITACVLEGAEADAQLKKLIVEGANFAVDMDSRLALCGVNGSGKSTFLNLLLGIEKPTSGEVFRHGKLRIGHFAQQHVDQLDLTLNAVQSLQAKYPEANLKDEAARTYLGKFGISGLLALEPLYILSGGQKSRVAIALMAYSNPHILLLDEPTNHLDLDAVQALIAALNEFEGGIVIVSHDSHLLSCVVDEIYYMDEKDHKLKKFYGDFAEYRKQLLKTSKVAPIRA